MKAWTLWCSSWVVLANDGRSRSAYGVARRIGANEISIEVKESGSNQALGSSRSTRPVSKAFRGGDTLPEVGRHGPEVVFPTVIFSLDGRAFDDRHVGKSPILRIVGRISDVTIFLVLVCADQDQRLRLGFVGDGRYGFEGSSDYARQGAEVRVAGLLARGGRGGGLGRAPTGAWSRRREFVRTKRYRLTGRGRCWDGRGRGHVPR